MLVKSVDKIYHFQHWRHHRKIKSGWWLKEFSLDESSRNKRRGLKGEGQRYDEGQGEQGLSLNKQEFIVSWPAWRYGDMMKWHTVQIKFRKLNHRAWITARKYATAHTLQHIQHTCEMWDPLLGVGLPTHVTCLLILHTQISIVCIIWIRFGGQSMLSGLYFLPLGSQMSYHFKTEAVFKC